MLPTLLLTLAAHAADPSPKIVNGEAEDGFPAAVALGAGSGDWAISMCSGSLITPRLILTAGHCGDGVPIETVVELGQAYFGEEVSDPDATLGFDGLAIHPDYEELDSGPFGTDLGAFDVAVLVLEDDAPVAPLRLNFEALGEEHIGMELLSVGFGSTSSSGGGSGTKRSTGLSLDDVDEMFLYSESDTSAGDGQICSGDSGGPQLAQLDDSGEWVQVAVHSWGDSGCRSRSGSTRVDVAWDFVLEQVEAEHGTVDLCEINGRYEDGTCDAWCDLLDPDCAVDEAPLEDGPKACSAVGATGGLLALLPGLLGSLVLRRRR